MEKTVDVSVIIVNWNTKQMLLDCIESLIKETHKYTMEIIVVDNASADGSPDAVRKHYPEIKLIVNKANLGFSKANNIGIKAATGRYVCLCNSDIIALDGVIDKMIDYMTSHPEIGALGPKVLDENYVLTLNCREIPTLRNSVCDFWFLKSLFKGIDAFRGRTQDNTTYDYTHNVGILSGCFMVVKGKALKEVGGLDERFFIYGEDTDWSKRFWQKGWKVVYYSDAQVIHIGGASSDAAPLRFILENEKADLQYWQKHHNLFVQLIYLFLKTTYRLNLGIIWTFISLLKKSNKNYSKAKKIGHLGCFKWLTTKSGQYIGKKNT